MVDKTVEESTETTTEMTVMVEEGTGPERGHFPEIMAIIELEAQAIVDLGQDPELVQIGIEYIVISIGNMITLQENIPLLREEREVEQLHRMLNLGDEQTVTPPMSEMQEDLIRVSSEENLKSKSFKLMKGRNGPTTFLPLSPKIGGQEKGYYPSIGQYLTREQANLVYKKTESGEKINTETLQQELEYKRQLDKIDDTSADTNPVQRINNK